MYFKIRLLKSFLFILILVTAIHNNAFGQIDVLDSSVQVIPLWNLNETNTYEVSYQQLTYLHEDTLADLTINYEVDITVIDSTEKSYTVRWQNRNFKVIPSNTKLQALYTAANNFAAEIKISHYGVFIEVINWRELKDSIDKSIRKIRKQIRKDPETVLHFQQMKAALSSKENIESAWVPDVHQFHMFQGSKYILNKEIKGTILTPNIYNSEEPFDTYVTVILEDINLESNKYTVRSFLEIDTEQLTNSTYDYLSSIMEDAGQEMIERDEFLDVSTFIETVSIFHNSGWLIDSVQWKTSISDETTNMEIRRIRFK